MLHNNTVQIIALEVVIGGNGFMCPLYNPYNLYHIYINHKYLLPGHIWNPFKQSPYSNNGRPLRSMNHYLYNCYVHMHTVHVLSNSVYSLWLSLTINMFHWLCIWTGSNTYRSSQYQNLVHLPCCTCSGLTINGYNKWGVCDKDRNNITIE